MADLVSMRADVAEARQKIDSILAIDGELSTDQVAELERVDKEFQRLSEEVRKAEIVDSARQSLAKPNFDFRGKTSAHDVSKKLDSREQFRQNLLAEIRNPGSFQARMIDFASGATGATGNAIDLLPVDLQNEMVRLLSEMSAVRQAATVRSYPNDVEIPVVTSRATITAYTGEGEAYETFEPDFGKLRIRSFKSAAETLITEEVLADSRGGVVSEILQQHAEAHAEFWEGRYLATSSVQNATNPDGILTAVFSGGFNSDNDITDYTISSGTGFGNVSYDDLVETAYGMPAAYWKTPKTWIVGPGMFRELLNLADGNGRPLLLPAATGTAQDGRADFNLLGYPVLVSDQMPGAGANAFAAVLLSKESYVVADRSGISTKTDDGGEFGRAGLTAYRSFVRADGRWMRPVSSARLKLAAS